MSNLLLDNRFWSIARSHDELDSQMVSHGPVETTLVYPIFTKLRPNYQSLKASQAPPGNVRQRILYNKRLDESNSREDKLLAPSLKSDYSNHQG